MRELILFLFVAFFFETVVSNPPQVIYGRVRYANPQFRGTKFQHVQGNAVHLRPRVVHLPSRYVHMQMESHNYPQSLPTQTSHVRMQHRTVVHPTIRLPTVYLRGVVQRHGLGALTSAGYRATGSFDDMDSPGLQNPAYANSMYSTGSNVGVDLGTSANVVGLPGTRQEYTRGILSNQAQVPVVPNMLVGPSTYQEYVAMLKREKLSGNAPYVDPILAQSTTSSQTFAPGVVGASVTPGLLASAQESAFASLSNVPVLAGSPSLVDYQGSISGSLSPNNLLGASTTNLDPGLNAATRGSILANVASAPSPFSISGSINPSQLGAWNPSLQGASSPILQGASNPSLLGVSNPSLLGASNPFLLGASQENVLSGFPNTPVLATSQSGVSSGIHPAIAIANDITQSSAAITSGSSSPNTFGVPLGGSIGLDTSAINTPADLANLVTSSQQNTLSTNAFGSFQGGSPQPGPISQAQMEAFMRNVEQYGQLGGREQLEALRQQQRMEAARAREEAQSLGGTSSVQVSSSGNPTF